MAIWPGQTFLVIVRQLHNRRFQLTSDPPFSAGAAIFQIASSQRVGTLARSDPSRHSPATPAV